MCGVFILHIVGETVVRCQTFAFVIDLQESVSDLEINLFLCVLIWVVLCQEKVQIKSAFFALSHPAKASAFSFNTA